MCIASHRIAVRARGAVEACPPRACACARGAHPKPARTPERQNARTSFECRAQHIRRASRARHTHERVREERAREPRGGGTSNHTPNTIYQIAALTVVKVRHPRVPLQDRAGEESEGRPRKARQYVYPTLRGPWQAIAPRLGRTRLRQAWEARLSVRLIVRARGGHGAQRGRGRGRTHLSTLRRRTECTGTSTRTGAGEEAQRADGRGAGVGCEEDIRASDTF